jgi:hypothetical protein
MFYSIVKHFQGFAESKDTVNRVLSASIYAQRPVA